MSYLYITEYSNMGDLSMETPVEPAIRTQKVANGAVSEPLSSGTRMVVLQATLPCRVAFFTGDKAPDDGFPMTENVPVTRIVHMSGGLRVAVLAEDQV
jgi:hypothetical protein